MESKKKKLTDKTEIDSYKHRMQTGSCHGEGSGGMGEIQETPVEKNCEHTRRKS